jgi:ubiquinone/menaquinone biosynthesis C-methylase UbiE
MTDNEFYTEEGGRQYLDQRAGARSDHVQNLRTSLFRDLGGDELTVLDFGCGTGGVIMRLAAARRIGVEVSTLAAERARAHGVEVCDQLERVEDGSVDVAISFHAIEHVDDPLHVLRQIRRVVKPEGRVRLVVPCETPVLRHQREWQDNHDRHLYTWTPLLFGNLAQRAGYTRIVARMAPMPTGSRAIRALRWLPPLAAWVHTALGVKRNSLNVILDARVA